MQQLLTRIAQQPALWATLRRIVENNYRGERAAIADELVPWRDVGTRRFLDFGCGTGEFTPSFPQAQYLGVDLSADYVRYAATQSTAPFAVMDGRALAVQDGVFDAALVLGVIHHLDDGLAHQTIAELHRVLRPDGEMLVLEDIPPPSIWNLPGRVMHWLDRGDAIRSDADYQRLFAPYFSVRRSWTLRSGICDYGVYRLVRTDAAFRAAT